MKKFLALIFVSLCAVLGLSACSPPPSFSAQFKQNEYVLNVGDVFDAKSNLNLKGVEFDQLQISFSNPQVLNHSSQGIKAGQSGETLVFASYQEQILAQCFVYVNYQFASPDNLQISKDGVLSWSEPTINQGANLIKPQQYIVEVGQEKLYRVSENSFSFADNDLQFGSYQVRIQAVGIEPSHILASQYSQSKTVVYDYVSMVAGLEVLPSQSFGDQTATLRWNGSQGVVYDVYFNDFKVTQTPLKTACLTYDFSHYSSGAQIEVEIVAYDAASENKKLSVSHSYIINKLRTVNASYVYNQEEGDGYLVVADDQPANGYIVYWSSIDGQTSGQKVISRSTKEFLDELDHGIYNISIQAVGGNNGDSISVNSNVSQSFQFAKLDQPQVQVEVGQEMIHLYFTKDPENYVRTYKVVVGSYRQIFDIETSLELDIDRTYLSEGANTLEVYALPKADNVSSTGVAYYSDGKTETNRVLNSKAKTQAVYRLEEFGQITHSFEGDASVLTFDNVDYADNFRLFVGEQEIKDFTFDIGSSRTKIYFSGLNSFEPNENNGYELTIQAFRNDGFAFESSAVKTLQILSAPVAEEAENGQFRWSRVESEAVYSYTISKTDSSWQNGQVVSQETTADIFLKESLPFGYYTIEVVARSANHSLQLDSNFHAPEKVLRANFIVTEQIKSPKITLIEDNGKFKISIAHVEFASRYTIFLEEQEIDSFSVSEEKDTYVRVLDQTFAQEQTYQISVVASAGEVYDETLHPASQPSKIDITRVAAPSYNVTEHYSQSGRFGIEGEYGQKLEERLTVSSGADDVFVENFEIKVDGALANVDLENYINLMGRGETFMLSLQAKAIADDEENGYYYLDSAVTEVEVSRLNRPEKFGYSNGEITFTDTNSGQSENYFVEIELFVESGNRTISFFANTTLTSVDIQEKIESFSQNKEFGYEFAQVEKIGIKVFAYISPQSTQGKLLLQSLEGRGESEEEQLIVEKMQSPVLSFTPDGLQGTFEWNRTGQNTVYDVYNGQTVMLKDFSGNQTSLESVLGSTSLTQENAVFKVVAKNPEYLNSSASNQITVAQLSQIDQITISQNGDVWQAKVLIEKNSDARRILQILVCGQPIDYQTGQSSAIFELDSYQDKPIKISLKAKNSASEQIYYLDSTQTQFSLTNVSSTDMQAEISNDKLSWQSAFESWQMQEGLVSFTIVVHSAGVDYTIPNIFDTSISLSEIEKLIQVELDSQQEITIDIYSNLSTFVLSNNGSAGYGKTSQNDIQVEKIDQIEKIAVQIELPEEKDLVLQQRASTVALSFADAWDGDVSFDVHIDDQLSFKAVSTTNPYTSCRVAKDEQGYHIYITSSMFVSAGQHKISVRVNQTDKISSKLTDCYISRNSDIARASLNSQGVLSVSYGNLCQDSVIVRVTIGQETLFTQTEGLPSQIDISNLLRGRSGGVSVDIIVVSSTNQLLCSPTNYNISTTKFAAIKTIDVSADGQILFTLPDNASGAEKEVEFVAQTEDGVFHIFHPTQTENIFVYSYSLQDFVKELSITQQNSYSLALMARAEGSLNSDPTSFTLNYHVEQDGAVIKKRSSQTSDYFVFNAQLQNGLSTSGFRIIIKDGQGQTLETQTVIVESNADLLGFWDGNTNQFVPTKPNYQGQEADKVYSCYALSINDILQAYDYGTFEIEVCRIAWDGQQYHIFSSENFALMKLNNVVEERTSALSINIEGNILSWHWVKADQALPENFAPTAYMISFWPAGSQEQTQSLIISENSLDLTTVNMLEGRNILTIQAISQDQSIIASSVLKTPLEPFKYSQTKSATLQSGRIVYDLNYNGAIDSSLDFVSVFDSSTGANIADNLAQIGQNGFSDIYNFQISTVASQTIKLRFVSTDSQGLSDTGNVYVASMNALNLMPNFTVENQDFLTQIKEYIDQHSQSSEVNFQQLVRFYQVISGMTQGVGDGKIIFDDFGKAIPAGYYNVSICQTATNPMEDYIDSNYSNSKLIYLSPAPTIAMDSTFDAQTGEETFTVQFNLVPIISDEGVMEKSYNYVMLLRRNSASSQENAYRFMISYDGAWSITSNGLPLEGVISGDELSFTINYTALGELMQGDDYLIDKSNTYNVHIYSVGNSRSSFGKSSVMNLAFLRLESSNLSVVDGYFIITTSENEIGSDILVKYRRRYGSDDEVQEEIVRTSQDAQGKVVLNDILTNSGLYDYVIFNVMGQIDHNRVTMKLPSDSYGILSPYKLNAPSLQTSENKLQISANSNDRNYGPFIYRLTNGELEVDSTSQYFVSSSGNLSSLVFDHGRYNVDGENEVRFISPSIAVIGIVENTPQENLPYFEYLIDLDGLVLSSPASQIVLQKLDQVSNFRIENGDLYWDEASLPEGLDQDVTSLYRLQIDYYDSTGYKGTQDFYTRKTSFDTSLIENLYSQGNGAYFNFSVYLYAGYSEGGQSLVEGGSVDIARPIQTESGAYVLHSNAATLQNVSKQATPSFAISEQTYQGKLVIYRNRATNLNFAIKLVSQSQTYDLVQGEDFEIERSSIILADNTQYDVYFISIINEDFASGSTFSLKLYAYSASSIKSEPLQTKAFYKLHSVALEDMQMQLIDEKNVLDLSAYFEKYLYSYSNSMYQIQLSLPNGQQFVLDSENMAYGDDSGESLSALSDKAISVVVLPKSGQTNYLASNVVNVKFNRFQEENPLSFAFNEQATRFEWNFANTKRYQFFIVLHYSSGGEEKAFVDNYQVIGQEEQIWQYYYQPSQMGTISRVELYARAVEVDPSLQMQVGLFGKIEVELSQPVEYKLFESGDGKEGSPYVIKTLEQFSNIALRDDPNTVVYFQLGSSLELTLSEVDHLLEGFYGHLDGNGQTLTIKFAKQTYQQAQSVGSVLLGSSTTSISFGHAQSLIGTLYSSATISNLSLQLEQSIDCEDYAPTVLSGLALFNYGRVENVQVTSISSTYSSSLSTIALAGVVGFNYGTIVDCQNNAQSEHTYPASAMILIYGGVALQNGSNGIIKGCESNAEISVSVRGNGSSVYGGGVVYENSSGQVYACGNNGAINITGSSYTAGFGGVIGRNIGKTGYLFNNKTLSSARGGVSGIIYYYRSGQLGDMFNCSGNDVIFAIYGGSADQRGKVYAYQNSASGLTVTTLPNGLDDGQQFVYNNEYMLQVVKEEQASTTTITILLSKV